MLLEIAKNPDVQKRLREEIRATERAIHVRGDSDFTATDLDNMEYLAAVMKVVFSPERTSCLFTMFTGINALSSSGVPKLSPSC